MVKFWAFILALAWLLGLVPAIPVGAQEISGAKFSSGPVTVTAWGWRSDILFVDMDVHVEKSTTALWIQFEQPSGCISETTSVATGAMLSAQPLIWMPVDRECFSQPVRFLFEQGGDIHLSFQAVMFQSVKVWWVSNGVSGELVVNQGDFSWSPQGMPVATATKVPFVPPAVTLEATATKVPFNPEVRPDLVRPTVQPVATTRPDLIRPTIYP